MIRHVVMWTFSEDAAGRSRQENLEVVKDMLEELPDKIPGLHRFDVGIDELAGPTSAHLVLVAELDDWAALDAYQSHPAHLDVVDYLADVRIGRWAVDYEM